VRKQDRNNFEIVWLPLLPRLLACQPDWFLRVRSNCLLCWLQSVRPVTKCCVMMMLLPPVKLLRVLFVMLNKCGLKRRQKLPNFDRDGKGHWSCFRKFFMVDSL